jgi:MFS family permease
MAGLALMAVASLAFGFAETAWLLGSARFMQGVGSALTWAAGLAWLVGGSPAERRGEVLGTAFGAAVGGVLLGPVLGAAARAAGTGPLFAAVAVLNIVLIVAAARTPAAATGAPGRARDVLEPLRDRGAAIGAALIVLVGMFFGVVEVLAPLRLDVLGAGGLVIAAAFLLDAAVQAATSRAFGRWIDRRGPQRAVRVGLVAGCALALAFPLPESVALVVLLIVASGPAVGVLWLPGMTLLSEGTERRGVDQAYAFGLLNLAWAGSALAGSGIGSALADATSDRLPYFALSTLFLAALVAAAPRPRAWRRP